MLYPNFSGFITFYNHGDTHLQPLLHQAPNTLKRDLRIAVAWSRQKRQTFLTMFARKGLCVKKHLREKYSVCNSLSVCNRLLCVMFFV